MDYEKKNFRQWFCTVICCEMLHHSGADDFFLLFWRISLHRRNATITREFPSHSITSPLMRSVNPSPTRNPLVGVLMLQVNTPGLCLCALKRGKRKDQKIRNCISKGRRRKRLPTPMQSFCLHFFLIPHCSAV